MENGVSVTEVYIGSITCGACRRQYVFRGDCMTAEQALRDTASSAAREGWCSAKIGKVYVWACRNCIHGATE